MAKLTTALIALAALVALTLFSGTGDAEGNKEMRLLLALPTASGGAQQLNVQAMRGEPIQISNLVVPSSKSQLPADAYRVSGTWQSDDTLELDVYVAETVSYRESDDATTWVPEIKFRKHRISVSRDDRVPAKSLQPAPGGEPRAYLISMSTFDTTPPVNRSL